ncbi:uncharacterized protein VTP21DRAFT_1836 [Calcarisporiella thermophila]|uniref:uncharacterized protein n=1 Tax=Calcarisporiella thermophila TaxID=911321 RepID=UPI003742A6FC
MGEESACSLPRIALASTDNPYANTLASYLLEMRGDDFAEIRCLCRDISLCKNLENKGANLRKIDYSEERTLNEALSGIEILVYVPEIESSLTNVSKLVMRVLQRENIGAVLLSVVGADQPVGRLKQFHEIEVLFEQLQWLTIMRVPFVFQLLWLWAPAIRAENCIRMTMGNDRAFAPVDLRDVARALRVILLKMVEDESRMTCSQYVKKPRYQLQGPEPLSISQIALQLSTILHKQITYTQVTREELGRNLRKLRDGRKSPAKGCFHGHPTDEEVEMLLDTLDLIEEGRANFLSEDLTELVGEEVQRMQSWLYKHVADFSVDS